METAVVEEYRFIWQSSFHGSALVRINRGGKNIMLYWTCRSFTYGSGHFWTCIDMPGWERLEAALLAAKFWALDPIGEERLRLDGATWVIEGRRRDVYRIVERWSPRGPIYELGRTFFDLAGPPIAEIELY